MIVKGTNYSGTTRTAAVRNKNGPGYTTRESVILDIDSPRSRRVLESIWMTPQAARELARQLNEVADVVERRNAPRG